MSDLFAAVARHSMELAGPIAREYAESHMLVTVVISRPTLDTYNRHNHSITDAVHVPYYAGSARMYEVSGNAVYDLGDEPQYFGTSYVSIPLSTKRPWINDDVLVVSHPDVTLNGRHYRITDVDSGGAIPAMHRCAVVGAEPAPGRNL